MLNFLKALSLVLVAGLLAAGHGFLVGTDGSVLGADRHAIGFEETKALEKVLWVDARTESAFEAAHMKGAILLNESNWESALGDLLLSWDPESTVVVYCDGADCGTSRSVAARLREDLGVESVFWLEGGWEALAEEEAGP